MTLYIILYAILGILTGIAAVKFLLIDDLMDNDWVPSRSDMSLLTISIFFWPLFWLVALAWFICYMVIVICKRTTR